MMLPSSPGMDQKTKGILFLVGGGVLLPLAVASLEWLVFSLPLLLVGGVMLHGAVKRPRAAVATRDDHWREYQQVHRTWCDVILREEADVQKRFSTAPRWYPIARIKTARRMDVFGGETEGWASLMHTAFAPLAQKMPVTGLDLTRRDLVRRALWADENGATAPRSVVLPSQLQLYDPLAGAQYPGDIAALVTSSENPHEDSARRDIEMGVLRRIADVLGDNVTLPRMLAAATSLLAPDAPVVSEQLSAQERGALLDPNFIVMLGGDSAGHLGRVSAALEALVRRSRTDPARVGTPPDPLPFFFQEESTVIGAAPSGDPESRRRLDNLLAGSLVDRLGRPEPCSGLLLLVGADRLSRPILEGLTAGAEDRGLRLVMFFEHLRGEARELLGRGASETIVMRLGNHDDALAAANFIGKDHRFVISSITLTVGTQFGGSDTHGFSPGRTGSFTTQNMGPDSATSGRSNTTNFSYSRSWSETENYGETSTRSEEFVARAEDIQRIPTTGFIYVTAVNGRKHVIFGDCHPAITNTPLVAARAIARR